METIVLSGFLIALSIEDIRWKEVHSWLLYAFLISGIFVWCVNGQISVFEFAGGIASGGVIWLMSRVMPDRIGSADGIVYASTGAFMGLTHNLMLIIFSAFLAGVGAVFAMTVLKRGRDDTMPLIPFVAAGYALLVLIMERI